MSETLTEQWKNGTLKEGWYYLLYDEDGSDSDCDYWNGYAWHFDYPPAIEVLAPVPTYQEHLESEAHCAVYSEINEWNKEKIEQLESKLSCISEQLKEANEVIKYYANSFFGDKQKDGTYLIYTRENALGRVEVTYDPNIANNYLEKWGVK